MYYEESVIDGVLHYRTIPEGEWEVFSLQQLTNLYCSAKNLNITLSEELEEVYKGILDHLKVNI
jgi:hypothetical protein